VTFEPCPVCGNATDRRLLAQSTALQQPVAALVAPEHPGWSVAQGICPTCAARYAACLEAQRSPTSLHTLTDPNTTFPYYHPAEETVLSQPERLADYASFDGAGVAIAFLDSGYYPHPDLLAEARWPGLSPAWQRLSAHQWQQLLRPMATRLVDYVDLTDDGEQVGLDCSSLWDVAGDSWHGQMTAAVAAGNGLLSGGRFRGYAPGAGILPIKIGRGGGRIPEEDILRGLEWLLRDDNWQRYGVRVVNISVGGDFPQTWQENPVCRAAHALAQRGVVVVAAAGNRGTEDLLAPAQTPTVLTVGGVDDQNRRWRPWLPDEMERLSLYHHNFGTVWWQHRPVHKPEVLALARWLPSPVLPPSTVFREAYTIGRLRQVLHDDEDGHLATLLQHWGNALHPPAAHEDGDRPAGTAEGPRALSDWMPEVWHSVRRRMNAHKWVHRAYQHVDGTSVAVAQVSAVAAQMVQANPALPADEVRGLLVATACPLPHLLPRQTGAGLLQPAVAVASALRTAGGPLTGYPRSGTPLRDFELQKMYAQGTLSLVTLDGFPCGAGGIVYFGCLAPTAQRVSLIGTFNRWQPGEVPLQSAQNGWWHVALCLPPGEHRYRFWVEGAGRPDGYWQRDGENPHVAESGFVEGHSVVNVLRGA
jgi:serine protease AprX